MLRNNNFRDFAERKGWQKNHETCCRSPLQITRPSLRIPNFGFGKNKIPITLPATTPDPSEETNRQSSPDYERKRFVFHNWLSSLSSIDSSHKAFKPRSLQVKPLFTLLEPDELPSSEKLQSEATGIPGFHQSYRQFAFSLRDTLKKEKSIRQRAKLTKSYQGRFHQKIRENLRKVSQLPHDMEGSKKNNGLVFESIGFEQTVHPILLQKPKVVVLSEDNHPDSSEGSLPKCKRIILCTNPNIDGSIDKNPSDFIDVNSDTRNQIRTKQGVKIIDPLRAALTWRDDEITGYSPQDPDDDGEGVNGVGFRPTPAEAYLRMQKRKQQLAAYWDQEAKDARKMRRERRSLRESAKMNNENQGLERRVRFKEVEVISICS